MSNTIHASLLCPHCGETTSVNIWHGHSGDMHICESCHADIVLDVWRPEDRDRFYALETRLNILEEAARSLVSASEGWQFEFREEWNALVKIVFDIERNNNERR